MIKNTTATEAVVANSRQAAGLVGPTLVAMLVAEFPLVQPHLYDSQIPPVVYLSGVLMSVAGLAVVRDRQAAAATSATAFTVLEGVLLVIALIIANQGYRRPPQ